VANGPVGSDVAAVIAGYRPRMPEAAGDFARATVAAVGPASPARAKALLWACARLASFGIGVGMDPLPAVLLHPSVIERFILVGTGGLSGTARRTLRTNLRHVAAVMGAQVAPVALPRQRAKAPYTAAQIAAFLGLADAQPTLARRMRAQALICLGAGAGLIGADLRRARGVDVVARSGGVVVVVRGRRSRVVPVVSAHRERVVASARFAGDGWMIGGVDPDRHNVTTPLISSLAGGVDLERLDTGRLRSTWLTATAQRIGLKAFMDAAGITCSQRLGDLIAGLGAASEADAVAVLGGRS
jgi:integrase